MKRFVILCALLLFLFVQSCKKEQPSHNHPQPQQQAGCDSCPHSEYYIIGKLSTTGWFYDSIPTNQPMFGGDCGSPQLLNTMYCYEVSSGGSFGALHLGYNGIASYSNFTQADELIIYPTTATTIDYQLLMASSCAYGPDSATIVGLKGQMIPVSFGTGQNGSNSFSYSKAYTNTNYWTTNCNYFPTLYPYAQNTCFAPIFDSTTGWLIVDSVILTNTIIIATVPTYYYSPGAAYYYKIKGRFQTALYETNNSSQFSEMLDITSGSFSLCAYTETKW